jgi:hypothetical protein
MAQEFGDHPNASGVLVWRTPSGRTYTTTPDRLPGIAVIWALAGLSAVPGMTYWMVACSAYLYIAIFGANVRICR